MKRVIGIGMVCIAIFAVMACQGTTDSGGSVTPLPIKMVLITGGTFQMVDTDERSNGNVTVSDFYLAETEVTQYQWESVMGSAMPNEAGSIDYGTGVNHPMYYVSWYDAVEFCNALSAKEGLPAYYDITKTKDSDTNNKNTLDTQRWLVEINVDSKGYRLPTEAEWEYAAGHGGFESDGTTPKARFTYAGTSEDGNVENVDDLGDYAWYRENNGSFYGNIFGTKAVKTKLPNAIGLYDMSGNMWEWCWDWHKGYTEEDKDDPTGVISGDFYNRIIRGGCWGTDSFYLRVAFRNSNTPSNNNETVFGFRVARNVN